jgi:hypothetical protein
MISAAAYQQSYELARLLNLDPAILPSPSIGDFNGRHLYAAMQDRAAQPYNGQPSPLSNKSPNTAQARMFEVFAFALELIGEELRVKSDWDWVQHFRLMGLSLSPADYPIINLVFERGIGSRMAGRTLEIPYPIEVRSRFNPNLTAITQTDAILLPDQDRVIIPARLNQIGVIPEIRDHEFTDAPPISWIEEVYNEEPPGCIVYEGRNAETLAQAMLRLRLSLQMQRRCVTTRDYHQTAIEFGAWSASALRGIRYLRHGDTLQGHLADFVTVVVYPTAAVNILKPFYEDRATSGCWDVLPAHVVPLSGTIKVKAQPHLQPWEIETLVRDKINQLNPPTSYFASNPPLNWGDKDFATTLASAVDTVAGIISVKDVTLHHAQTQQPLSTLDVDLYWLFKVQDDIKIVT